jgi:hypothetical protein
VVAAVWAWAVTAAVQGALALTLKTKKNPKKTSDLFFGVFDLPMPRNTKKGDETKKMGGGGGGHRLRL